ncbi:zinc-dependent alcohol dehydrogenase [Alkalihalobacillus sp. 1P02AB]|uniref:zinc-dependent alcohol dehydrogenase n=1 Tax=Alkalihalobacillus sp. 1P02AB TaxID=3132260 RepID=UPI0039A5C66F
MSQMMEAVMIDKERVLRISATPVPVCRPNEAVIKVYSVGVCATDLHVYQGMQNHRIRFPIIPGHEWSGEVVSVGAEVKTFEVGDRVVGEVTVPCGVCKHCKKGNYNICPSRVECGVFGKNGAAAQYICVPVTSLHKIPPTLSFDDACLIEPSAIVYRGIEKVGLTPGDKVLVVGAGPIGLLTVAIAKVFGASTVVLVDLQSNRLEIGKELGATDTINISTEDYSKRANEITNGDLFDVIIEASGSVNAVEDLFEFTAPGARVCLLGILSEKANIDMNSIIRKDVEVYGSVGCPNVWEKVIPLVEGGRIPVNKIVTHHYTLYQFEEALLQIENRDPSIIKAIINPND